MRIIAGIAKGRSLKMPQCSVTRPATDKVRSAVFSILESIQPDWSRALDLFAGSGAVGLEALSRGADWVDFVDQDRHCCATIKLNGVALGFSDRMHVYCGKVARALSFLEGKYGLVFIDPPYADNSLPPTLETLAGSRLVGLNTVLVALHSARRPLEERYGRLRRFKDRRYGDTCISLFKEEAVS